VSLNMSPTKIVIKTTQIKVTQTIIKGDGQMPKGVVLYPDGTYEEKDFNGLKDMQDAVNGLIEIVHMYDYYGDEVLTGYVNEEGILLGLPLNTVASALSFMFGNNPMMLGNMIVLGKDDGEGNDTDIPQDITAFIKKVCADKNKIEAEYEPTNA
jgi:hypothetical protein